MKAYESWQSFFGAINRAIGTCTTLKISVADNFGQTRREINGVPCEDYKLTRFACCLIALNGDTKKTRVAAAQAYFVSLADALQKYLQGVEDVERVRIREDISEREVTLSGVAKAAGVQIYPYFQNAGYRGMYNRDYKSLRRIKGIPEKGGSLLDFMCKDELAYNLFRLSLTEGRLRKEGTKGQRQAEYVAEDVGRRVRRTVIEETGIKPEEMPISQDIKLVKGGLKTAHRELRSLDSPNPPKAKPKNG